MPHAQRKILRFAERFAQEPPIRLFSRMAVKYLANSIRLKADWDAVARPHYLVGMLGAADQAKSEGINEISVIEFGVAAGGGLLEMQKYAESVERETGITINVYGFDNGQGLPNLCGDYRDHPDQWKAMDYPMNEDFLRSKLTDRTSLFIGNVKDTLSNFVKNIQSSPVGFISFDFDLYSSTMDAFQIFLMGEKKMLRRTTIYFDDIDFFFNHKFAGELLAIDEFNASNDKVKIDIWRGLHKNRIFHENNWLNQMYVAHDIERISRVNLEREPSQEVT